MFSSEGIVKYGKQDRSRVGTFGVGGVFSSIRNTAVLLAAKLAPLTNKVMRIGSRLATRKLAPKAVPEATQAVSRWGRQGLEAGDWVMKGPASRWNYFWSGKWQPGFGNQFASFSSGQNFWVSKTTLRWPSGPLGWTKGLLGQRIYIPPTNVGGPLSPGNLKMTIFPLFPW